MANTLNLSNLKKHETAVVNKIDGSLINSSANLNKDVESRLLEMGFIEGSTIKIMHLGAFSGPIAVRINNYNTLISLRKAEAAAILVERAS